MAKENRLMLDTITAYFNTIWNNIDPERYFNIGFELFGKRFSYRRFMDRKILLQYIQYDKMVKREIRLIEDDIKSSVSFVKSFVSGKETGSKLIRYCSMKNGYLGIPVQHYLENKLTKSFMIFLMWYGFYKPSEDELSKMPYIEAHYRTVATNFNKETIKLCDIM